MSIGRRSDSIKDLGELKQTITNKMKKFQQSVSNLHSLDQVDFPEGKILEKRAYTSNIDSCVAFIIYNEDINYLFGHYPSISFSDNGRTVDLFKDEIPRLLTEFKKINKSSSSFKALMVGGDTDLFNQIHKFLTTEYRIEVSGTYLDKFNVDNYIEQSLYNKTLEFNPITKKGLIYTPLLKTGLEVLNGKDIRPYDDIENTVFLRSESYNYYFMQGIHEHSTAAVSDTKKVNGGLISRSCTTSLLEHGKFAPPPPPPLSPNVDDEPLTGVLNEGDYEDEKPKVFTK